MLWLMVIFLDETQPGCQFQRGQWCRFLVLPDNSSWHQ